VLERVLGGCEGRDWGVVGVFQREGTGSCGGSGGGGVGSLLVLGAFVAAVVYLRRRSRREDRSAGQ
jgi:hypothetical protein